MKIIIECSPKEIAALVWQAKERQSVVFNPSRKDIATIAFEAMKQCNTKRRESTR